MSSQWMNIVEQATITRRHLHRHPELGWHETQTAELIRQRLTELAIPWRTCATTGTIAVLNKDAAGEHIALRGDIDALPIIEDSGKEWSSTHTGCMHACGHDGHTAALLATAQWLKQHESSLKGPVSLLFQPAEEGGHGAREMIADGALNGVDMIFGWHNWPALPYGKIACPDGIVMCGNGTFTITVNGQGGHASQPELCRDPVLAASAINVALQQAVSRRLAPQQASVLSVTSIDAPSAPTVIPEKAVLGGSIRVPDMATRDTLNQLITEISHHTAASYGVTCEVDIVPRYNATINHASAAELIRSTWSQLYGSESFSHELRLPIMASEDFSYYLQEIPGAFALIGADDGNDHHYPCHSSHYDFNDRLLADVAQWYSALVGAPSPSTTD